MGLKIFLGFLAICFISQCGFDFAYSNGYVDIKSLEDYKRMAYVNLVIGILCLYFIGKNNDTKPTKD